MKDSKISKFLFLVVISTVVWQGTVLAAVPANETVTNLTYSHNAILAVPHTTPSDSKREQVVSASAYNRRVEEYTITTTPLLTDQDKSTGGKAFPWNATTALLTLHDGITQNEDETTSSPLDSKEPTIFSNPWNRTSFNITSSKTLCATGPYGSDFIQIFCHCDRFCNIFEDCCEPYHPCDRSSTNDEHIALSYEIDIRRNQVDCIMHSLDSRSLMGLNIIFYWMVMSCPNSWLNDTTRARCENRTSGDDIDRLLPVSDSVTKLTFRNRYCAMCHSFEKFENWSPIATCNKYVTSTALNISAMTLTADVLKGVRENLGCMLYFEPPATIPGRRCIPKVEPHRTNLNWITKNHCNQNTDPKHVELCSFGLPFFTSVISAIGQEIYMRNVFCWRCLFGSDVTLRVESCSSDMGASRSFDPFGLGVLINPSPNPESCSLEGRQDICGDESDQCSSPILSIFNMDFPLKMVLRCSYGPLDIKQVGGVCPVFKDGIHKLFKSDPPPSLTGILGTRWLFLSPYNGRCAELSANDTGGEWHNSSVLATLSSQVRLRKEIRSYLEGLKMFESFRYILDKELRTNAMFITLRNVDYQINLSLDEENPCASMDKSLESNVKTHTEETENGNALVSRCNQFSIQWAFAVCAFGVFVSMGAFAPSG